MDSVIEMAHSRSSYPDNKYLKGLSELMGATNAIGHLQAEWVNDLWPMYLVNAVEMNIFV